VKSFNYFLSFEITIKSGYRFPSNHYYFRKYRFARYYFAKAIAVASYSNLYNLDLFWRKSSNCWTI